MSHDGQPAAVVVTFPMPPGFVFDWHTHENHQLAWAASGVLTVHTAETAFVLPPTRALWIPARLPHETLSAGAATMRTVYLRPAACPLTWTGCTPVVAGTLLGEMIAYLEDPTLDAERRAHGEAVLVDLLRPVAMTTIDVRMPVDDRASRVALLLAEDPADNRTLAEWGREVGASARTLARTYVAETGLPFGQWRVLLRLRAATVALAAGEPISRVARNVGYESTSAFVAAFRRHTGVTPAAFFRSGSPLPRA